MSERPSHELVQALLETESEVDALRSVLRAVLYQSGDGGVYVALREDVDVLADMNLTPAESAALRAALDQS